MNLLKYLNLYFLVTLYSISTIPNASSTDILLTDEAQGKKWQVLNKLDQQSQGTTKYTTQLFAIGEAHILGGHAKACYQTIQDVSQTGTKVNFFIELCWERFERFVQRKERLSTVQSEDDYATQYPSRDARSEFWKLKIFQVAQDKENVRVIPIDAHYVDGLKEAHRIFTTPQWNYLACYALPDLKKKKSLHDLIDIEWSNKEELISLDEFILEAQASADVVQKVMTCNNSVENCSIRPIRDQTMADNLAQGVEEDALNIALIGMMHEDGVSKGFLARKS